MSVKGTIHWVSIPHAVAAQINLYDRLFKAENPSSEEGDFKEYINPDSLQVITGLWNPHYKMQLLLTVTNLSGKDIFVLTGKVPGTRLYLTERLL
jgi:hypothetical protein